MPKPKVLLLESVTALTVPEIRGLKMPAASPMLIIVRAMPVNVFVYNRFFRRGFRFAFKSVKPFFVAIEHALEVGNLLLKLLAPINEGLLTLAELLSEPIEAVALGSQ